VLPAGISASGASLDPGAPSGTVGARPVSLSLGERDYSSAGSTGGAVAVGAATAHGGQASQGGGTPLQSAPMICPQLAFAPLVSGCETVLGPLNGPVGEKLAHTGTPIVLGLAGLFLVGIGTVLYRRSSRPRAFGPLRRVRGLGTR
jgi:hypothetical protein